MYTHHSLSPRGNSPTVSETEQGMTHSPGNDRRWVSKVKLTCFPRDQPSKEIRFQTVLFPALALEALHGLTPPTPPPFSPTLQPPWLQSSATLKSCGCPLCRVLAHSVLFLELPGPPNSYSPFKTQCRSTPTVKPAFGDGTCLCVS